MSSYEIRQQARQVLKNLPGKAKLFGFPIILTLLSGFLQNQLQNLSSLSESETTSEVLFELLFTLLPFSLSVEVLLGLLVLAASYTMLEVIRGQRTEVSHQQLSRTFTGTYFGHLILITLAETLLLLPWIVLMILSIVLVLFGDSIGNPGLGFIGWAGFVAAFVMLIVKGFAYGLSRLILFDRIEDGRDLNPFEIIKESVHLMKGQKFNLFVLQLSFFGWNLLTVLTLGFLIIYVLPYQLTAQVIFYNQLKHQKMA